jgi:tetratricopeptide (TPR) repeat protein/tRNA A-37 threonylcarbamoyl transferase component Bud32
MRPADAPIPTPPNATGPFAGACARFEADWGAGLRPLLEDFLAGVGGPERPALLRQLLALELQQRTRRGEAPAAEEYRRRLPEYAAVIVEAFAPLTVGLDTPMTPGPLAPAEGFILGRAGRYEVQTEIARGGMGAVWLARDPELKRPLAIKVLRPEYRGRPELERRFREEAQITGQLQHPGIPPVHEVGTLSDGRPFLAMKLIKGRTLAELLQLRPSPAADLPRFLGIFEQVCQTLAYAHSKGVLHRDLKPSNVMVGAFGEVQVMDWGLAKVLGSRGGEATETDAEVSAIATERTGEPGQSSQAGAVLGTPAYMAPEQARGEVEQLDERCDVFGLGGVLCAILTGRPPFRGQADQVRWRAAAGDLGDTLARLDASGADVEVVRLARACLAPDREGRPRDAGAVAHAVGAYLAGVQERLRAAERQRAVAEARAVEERKRRRLAVVLAGAVLLLVLAGGGVAWLFEHQRVAAQARQDAAGQKTLRALEQAGIMLEKGWKEFNLDRLKEAKAEGYRAEEAALTGGAANEVQQQVAAFLKKARERIARAEKNRLLMDSLLDFWILGETRVQVNVGTDPRSWLVGPSADEQYAAAFQRWGLDMDRTAEANVIARLREEPEPVVQEILAGLDSWWLERRLSKRPRAEWQRLARIAQALDDSAMRRQLRELWTSQALPRQVTIVTEMTRASFPWTGLCELERGELWRWMLQLRSQVDPAREPVLSVVLLAKACVTSGDAAGARELLHRAVVARPNQAVLYDALGRVLALQKPPRLGEAIECYKAARALRPPLGIALSGSLFRAGRMAEAEAILRELLHQQPTNPSLYSYLGYLLHGQNKLDAAVAAYREALRLKLDFLLVRYNLGHALEAQGKLPEAVAAFKEALRRKPDFPDAQAALGNVLYTQRKIPEAVAAFKEALRLKPDFSLVRCNLGHALQVQGKLPEAEVVYREALRLKPDYPEAHGGLGNILYAQRKLPEAVAAYKEALRLKPDLFESHYNLGIALQEQGKPVEAVVAYREALRLKPDFQLAHTHLGSALAAQGKLPEAVAAFREALRLKPDYPAAHANLGSALAAQGKLPEAVAAFREALRLMPDFAQAHYNLGIALAQQGEFRKALAELRRGHELGSRDPRWRHPSAQWLRRCERLIELDEQLPGFLEGKRTPASAHERIELAEVCALKGLYWPAARLAEEAFAARPNLLVAHRYHAACYAALAGCGRGKDKTRPDAKESARLRRQALAWLRAYLDVWAIHVDTGQPQARATLARMLTQWERNSHLAVVRDTDALKLLPEDEREAWRKLWAAVAALRERAGGK